MRSLRFLFVALFAASVLLVDSRGRWEGHLVQSDGTWIVNLPAEPVWSPPAVPSYQTFRKTFDTLPPEATTNTSIVRVFRFDTAMLDLAFCATIAAGVSGLIYLLIRQGSRDAMLHFALFISVGEVIAAASCFGLWLFLGGWGPPYPLLFALLGFGLGIHLGRWQWRDSPQPW